MPKYKYCLWLFCFFVSLNVTAQIPAANSPQDFLPLLKGKRVGLVVNQTSMSNNMHLVDLLLARKVKVTLIFAPEHGFRGDHSAGETVKSGVDPKTKLPLVSLYGNNKKPTAEQLAKTDIIIFDIQDVGARFYTYISTLHYVMEACAEQKKLLLVLDRPNPNGFYTDGPILDTAQRSFVGMHPVPIVHGCTVGEYARMINGQKWLKAGIQCNLKVMPVKNYTHDMKYALPVKPSPNLPTMNSIYLYPSLCLFEGTSYSVGRGTPKPFEWVGKPGCTLGNDTFTPANIKGVAEHPPHEGKLCNGVLLSDYARNLAAFQPQLNLFWMLDLYKNDPDKEHFFIPFFDKLAGTAELRKQIQAGKTEQEIRQSWQPGLKQYKEMRRQYLLYSIRE